MTHEHTALAALNNAIWCDTVCRAHGSPGELRDEIWINRRQTPPYYPNAVTLGGPDAASAQLEQLRELRVLGQTSGWGVKDSFYTLDLAPLGYSLLFEARWIYRAPDAPLPARSSPGLEWRRLTNPQALAAWEAAWSGAPAGAPAPEPRLFLPSLLENEALAFLAAYQQGRIVAGAIANRSGPVVGLSNAFAPARGRHGVWGGCIALLAELFPGLPLVGYERGAALEDARSAGFAALGPLRVWLKESADG